MSTATHRPLPPDETMALLLALATGRELLLHAASGRMAVVLDEGKTVEVPGDVLDDLMSRGWVVPDDDEKVVATTETGVYWLRRWLDRQDAKPSAKRRPRRTWRR
jgi:hypothetical protein